MWLTLVACTAVVLLCRWAWRIRRLPPGPWGLPLVGYLPWIDPEHPYLTLTALARRYGPIYSMQMGRILAVVVSDHKLVRKALAMDVFAGRAELYLTHGIMQGYGLICAEGERWREQRRFVVSWLKSSGMVKYGAKREHLEANIMVGVSECIQKLQRGGGVSQLDPSQLLLHCMGNVMNSLVFGRTWAEDDPTWKWLQHLSEEGVKHIGVAGPLNFLPVLRWLPRYRNTIEFIVDGMEQTHRVYQEVIDAHADGGEDLVAAFLEAVRCRHQHPGSFTQKQFYHLLADIFGAGLDTTLTTLRWFLVFMATNPQIQAKMQLELDSVCSEGAPRLKDMPSLPFTEACLAETQRLRSIVPLGIPHGALSNTELGGYSVPRGAMLVPLQWALHMDPAHWERPQVFWPDHFIQGGKFSRPEAFIPFQTGKRICVGEKLAGMMLFLFGATIVHGFRVEEPPEGIQEATLMGDCGITLVPGKHRLQFTPRDQ